MSLTGEPSKPQSCRMLVGQDHELARAALSAVSNVVASLGRHLLCLDDTFRIVFASASMRDLLGGETFGPLEGRPVADVLGKELFGVGAPLRDALIAGERREGWRALLQTTQGIRPLSITAAPMMQDATGACDARVKYVVLILPAEDDHIAAASAPAVLSGLIARSVAMSRIFQLVENLQTSDAPVLLTGERGTGKEVVARAIHEHSPRRRGPFTAVNCAALPPDLLESELFGHVRGAFTGALNERRGKFELANGGTLFLDEVGELSLTVQAKLLRVLQSGQLQRLGSDKEHQVDVRLIAATNRDLADEVRNGRYRADFYHLSLIHI